MAGIDDVGRCRGKEIRGDGCPVRRWINEDRVRAFHGVTDRRVRDAVEGELLVDVGLRADDRDALQLIRRRAIGEPVQQMPRQHRIEEGIRRVVYR